MIEDALYVEKTLTGNISRSLYNCPGWSEDVTITFSTPFVREPSVNINSPKNCSAIVKSIYKSSCIITLGYSGYDDGSKTWNWSAVGLVKK